MTKLTCQNCGAPLDRSGKCSYCGTIHKIEVNAPMIIHTGPAHMIGCQTSVSPEMARYMNEKDLAEYTLKELRDQLAEGLMGFMEICTEYDRNLNAQIFRGTVRVIPPGVVF